MNVSNVVNVSKEIKDLSSVKPGQSLPPGDIASIASILENIVLVKEKANEVGYDLVNQTGIFL